MSAGLRPRPDTRERVHLGPVEETALMPVWARATDARSRRPVLADLKSDEILRRLEFDFRRVPCRRRDRAGVCLRALQFDGWVRGFLAAHPRARVIDLGCGLDTRFERTDNGLASWFELDLPDVIALRRRLFVESPRRRFVAASLSSPDWPAQLSPVPPPGATLIVAESVFMYLGDADARATLDRLARHFPGATLLCDAADARSLARERDRLPLRTIATAQCFAVASALDLTRASAGLRIDEWLDLGDVAARFGGALPLRLRLRARLSGLLASGCYRLCRLRLPGDAR